MTTTNDELRALGACLYDLHLAVRHMSPSSRQTLGVDYPGLLAQLQSVDHQAFILCADLKGILDGQSLTAR